MKIPSDGDNHFCSTGFRFLLLLTFDQFIRSFWFYKKEIAFLLVLVLCFCCNFHFGRVQTHIFTMIEHAGETESVSDENNEKRKKILESNQNASENEEKELCCNRLNAENSFNVHVCARICVCVCLTETVLLNALHRFAAFAFFSLHFLFARSFVFLIVLFIDSIDWLWIETKRNIVAHVRNTDTHALTLPWATQLEWNCYHRENEILQCK